MRVVTVVTGNKQTIKVHFNESVPANVVQIEIKFLSTSATHHLDITFYDIVNHIYVYRG